MRLESSHFLIIRPPDECNPSDPKSHFFIVSSQKQKGTREFPKWPWAIDLFPEGLTDESARTISELFHGGC